MHGIERKHIDWVRIEVGGELVELPWKTSQKLRGMLVGARRHSIAEQFAAKGTSAPIVLDRGQKEDLLGAVHVCMDELSDETARHLLPLRDALRAELGRE